MLIPILSIIGSIVAVIGSIHISRLARIERMTDAIKSPYSKKEFRVQLEDIILHGKDFGAETKDSNAKLRVGKHKEVTQSSKIFEGNYDVCY